MQLLGYPSGFLDELMDVPASLAIEAPPNTPDVIDRRFLAIADGG